MALVNVVAVIMPCKALREFETTRTLKVTALKVKHTCLNTFTMHIHLKYFLFFLDIKIMMAGFKKLVQFWIWFLVGQITGITSRFLLINVEKI